MINYSSCFLYFSTVPIFPEKNAQNLYICKINPYPYCLLFIFHYLCQYFVDLILSKLLLIGINLPPSDCEARRGIPLFDRQTIKKEPDDNIYCHQAPGYTAKIVKTIPYSIHIEKNNQEQYFDYPKNLKSHNINRKQIGFMKSTGCL